MQGVQYFQCHVCNSFVKVISKSVHKMMCQSKRLNKRQFEIKKSRIKNESALKKYKQQQNSINDLIPCNLCGQMISFQIYSFHSEQCLQLKTQICNTCYEKYPSYLIQEHKAVCKVPEQKIQKKKEKWQIRQHFEQQIQIPADEELQDFEEFQMHVSRLASEHVRISIPQEKQKIKGLTSNQISKLIRFNNKKINVQCSICYCKVQERTKIAELKCGHSFHGLCIEPWLKTNPTCPMCRKHVIRK